MFSLAAQFCQKSKAVFSELCPDTYFLVTTPSGFDKEINERLVEDQHYKVKGRLLVFTFYSKVRSTLQNPETD